jgi:hypothetical protein
MKYVVLITLILILVIFSTCKKKKTNTDLFEESKGSGLSFYKGKDTIYSPAGDSPHGKFKLKFNSIAQSKLDASGKLPAGATFDNGALIVKEVYENSTLTLYAVMKKDAKSKFSANGWLWAEYAPDGSVKYDVSKQGEACTSCHSATTNRDHTRSFDLH